MGKVLREGNLRGALATLFATSMLCAPLITFCPVLVHLSIRQRWLRAPLPKDRV